MSSKPQNGAVAAESGSQPEFDSSAITVARPRVGTATTGILFLSSPEQPGADTAIHARLMRGLDRSRFDVHVACSAGVPGARTPAFEALATIPDLHLRPSNFGPLLTGRSKIEKLALSGVPMFASLGGLVRYVRQNRISLLHATDRVRDALPCVVLAKLTGAKSIIHVHVKYADWMSRSVRWAMARADALVGISQFVARSLVENGYRPQKTHVVLNAIEAADWEYRLDPGPVRRELGLALTAPVVMCIGRLFLGKGQDSLIRALPLVLAEIPEVRLVIVGGDDRLAMRTSFTAELETLAHDLGVRNHVVFTGYRTDIPALLAASDIFALPSFEEPFGLVFLEALAMKKPVVALDNGGTPEVVEHGKSGLLSAPDDIAALAANLLVLIRDPPLRARMGEYGRRQVETRFTPERMARDAEQVYASLARP
jgi:glycosyltransferase involved in cell wall biosynthesis